MEGAAGFVLAEREGSVEKAGQLLFGEAKQFKPAGGCYLAGCGRREKKSKGAQWGGGCVWIFRVYGFSLYLFDVSKLPPHFV